MCDHTNYFTEKFCVCQSICKNHNTFTTNDLQYTVWDWLVVLITINIEIFCTRLCNLTPLTCAMWGNYMDCKLEGANEDQFTLHTCVCTWMCACLCLCVCVCVYIHVVCSCGVYAVCVCVCVCVRVCMRACMGVCYTISRCWHCLYSLTVLFLETWRWYCPSWIILSKWSRMFWAPPQPTCSRPLHVILRVSSTLNILLKWVPNISCNFCYSKGAKV